jgi:amidase
MKRREFLQLGMVFGGVNLAASASVRDGPVAAGAPSAFRPKPFELQEATLADLQAGMRSGRYTAVAVTRKYLARIAEVDQRGPSLHSVIELNPDALAMARELDRERRAKGPRGPLHGIPVVLKDNIDTHDRMTTTAGSLALAGSIPAKDAFVAHQLREAGAVLLGKTNPSEWANFRSAHSTSGWSGRGGLTRNPYVLDRNPSGSSSGSAVAVAANLCAVAVGTETDGSILSPASYNGVVGLKPTVGLISRAGIVPIAHSQDTAGPMARSVRDAAILLGALVGADPRDEATGAAAGHARSDYTRFLDPDGLRGSRVGVARKFCGRLAAVDQVLERVVSALRSAGAVVIDPADLASQGRWGDAEFEVMAYEFKADLNAYLAGLGVGAPVHSLREVIEFNVRHRDREMPWFGQDLLEQAEARGPLSEPTYREALATCRRLSREEGIDAVMEAHQLDALLAPTTGPAHVTDLIHGDRDTGGSTGPAAVAGYPSITVPAGFVSDLPVGISFFGPAWSEPTLLRLAFAFEQMMQARKPPAFKPSIVG